MASHATLRLLQPQPNYVKLFALFHTVSLKFLILKVSNLCPFLTKGSNWQNWKKWDNAKNCFSGSKLNFWKKNKNPKMFLICKKWCKKEATDRTKFAFFWQKEVSHLLPFVRIFLVIHWYHYLTKGSKGSYFLLSEKTLFASFGSIEPIVMRIWVQTKLQTYELTYFFLSEN